MLPSAAMLPITAYAIYLLHFAAFIYFGVRDPNDFIGAPYQPAFSLGVILIGIALYIPAFFNLGVKKSSHIKFSGLITSGIYGYVRNPQLMGWGSPPLMRTLQRRLIMGRTRSVMPRKKYSAEFKAEAVELVRSSSSSASEVARDLGLGPTMLNR